LLAEAYVIYNFYMLMLNFLGGGKAVREILKKQVRCPRTERDPPVEESLMWISVCGLVIFCTV
jgi:hypothetical protein